jgi:hypothetical protein
MDNSFFIIAAVYGEGINLRLLPPSVDTVSAVKPSQSIRHCERSEAIHAAAIQAIQDCFVASLLAMTGICVRAGFKPALTIATGQGGFFVLGGFETRPYDRCNLTRAGANTAPPIKKGLNVNKTIPSLSNSLAPIGGLQNSCLAFFQNCGYLL